MSEYISISEFAKRAGVSRQAVYKRMDELNRWLKVDNGKKTIDIKALEIFNGTKTTTEVDNSEALLRMVSMLEKELEIKNKQIEELNARLKESHILIDQQQKLHAIAEVTQPEPLEADPVEPAEEKKKWWQRIF